ncbi:MAG: YbaY family lipoprotein [Balneolaceae bacterium]|nr:YbaY family lipoprotein [Balneolaceae bacterium]
MTIKGNVTISEQIPSFSNAELHVFLQDIGRMDAPATVLRKITVPDISHQHGERDRVAFTMTFDERNSTNPHPRYNLRAHVDKAGNAEVDKGDLVTTQSYPVDLDAPEAEYEIEVKEVR